MIDLQDKDDLYHDLFRLIAILKHYFFQKILIFS